MRDEAISKTEQLFSLRVFKLMLVTGLLLLAGGIVRAQENTVTQQKGFQAGSSYAISDIESINTLNGNVMLSVPLGSLPSGRGGSSAGIGLMYNSKLWDVIEGVSRTGCGMNPDCQGIPYRFIARGEGGWRYNTRYELKNLGESVSTNLNAGDINFGVCNQSSVDLYRYVVVTPDGGQHELFISTPLESFHGNNGGLTYDLDGTPISSNCWNSTLSRPPAGTVMSYYTLDGTFLRLDVTVLSGNALNWVLRMPNGGRVEVTSGVSGQKIYDRNNNYVLSEQILNYNGTGHAATKLSDQLGRETVIEIGAGPDEDWIYSRGFNNELLTTKVKWKKLYVNRTYYAIPGGVSSIKSFFKEQRVVESITLPSQTSGLQYRFAYNANDTNSSSLSTGWGELSSVTLPSGAVSAYSYKQDNSAQNVLAYDIVHNSPTQKTLTYQDENDGGSGSITELWNYDFVFGTPQKPQNAWSTITGPDGGVTKQEFKLDLYKNPKGQSYRTTAPDGTIIERSWLENRPYGIYIDSLQRESQPVNPYVKTEWTTIQTGSTPIYTTARDYTYDKNENAVETREYDWVNYASISRDGNGFPTSLPSSSALRRITRSSFYNPTITADITTLDEANSYHKASSPNIHNAVATSEILDGGSVVKSRSELTYDNVSMTANLIGTKAWDSSKGGLTYPLTAANSVSSTMQYDQYGNPTLSTDAKGVQTTITYGNIAGPNGTVTGLYPTQTEAASNYSTLKRTSTAAYDFYTGLVTSATDVDNNITNATEYDALGRPKKSISALGTALESWTTSEYHDVDRFVVVRSDIETKGDARKVAVQHYDQLGRVRLSRSIENIATEDPYIETHGIKVETRYSTGNPNSYQLTSNPFRAAYASQAANEPTMGWTRSKSINTGRHSEVETFSGSALPAPWGSNTISTGIVQTDSDADRTLVTDQAGKQRISRTNALGQLKDIWEIMSASDSSTESVTFPNTSIAYGYKTNYSYDTLNNLTAVNQGVQTRSFVYDSLSRLKSATNPESGLIQYSYDNNSNLTSKVDARNITTSYAYDALNRVTARNYSDGTTPNVSYTYDDISIPFSKGKLTKVSNSVSETRYTGFDILGRVLSSQQITDGQTYSSAYAYNLSGALVEQTYPSGRVVKNTLDVDGDLAQVQSKKVNDTFKNYANSFTYNAAGAVR